MLPVLFRQQGLKQTEDNYYLLYLCILCCLSCSACVLIVTFVLSNFNVSVAEILWKFGVWYSVFVDSTTSSVLRHVRVIGTVQSIQLSVIFVFHVVSMTCLSPSLTFTSLCSLVCFLFINFGLNTVCQPCDSIRSTRLR